MIDVYYDRSPEYDEYLRDHIGGVIKSWYHGLRNYIDDVALIRDVDEIIERHDLSKRDPEEYVPYLNHFYPSDYGQINEDDDPEFDKAWLIHIHKNPHHWQHWILRRDSGDTLCIDMPMKYVCEMLCDWSSFKYKDPSSTAHKWYNDNKDNMIFSDNTRMIVESLLERCPEL